MGNAGLPWILFAPLFLGMAGLVAWQLGRWPLAATVAQVALGAAALVMLAAFLANRRRGRKSPRR